MDIICMPHGGGKTTILIDKIRRNNSILLVRSELVRKELKELYPDLSNKIYNWNNLWDCDLSSYGKIYIDDIDRFLSDKIYYGSNIVGFSITGEKEWNL